MAIWWAASAAGFNLPISAVATANTPISTPICVAAGSPSSTRLRMRARSGASGVLSKPVRCRRSCRRMTTSSTTAMYTRAAAVDHADPSAPIGGAPQCP